MDEFTPEVDLSTVGELEKDSNFTAPVEDNTETDETYETDTDVSFEQPDDVEVEDESSYIPEAPVPDDDPINDPPYADGYSVGEDAPDASDTNDVIWTNSSATSAFASQDISITTLNNYNLFTIVCGYTNSASTKQCSRQGYITSDSTVLVVDVPYYDSSKYVSTALREFTFSLTDSKITIGAGKCITASSVSTDNNYCIPLYIIGSSVTAAEPAWSVATMTEANTYLGIG